MTDNTTTETNETPEVDTTPEVDQLDTEQTTEDQETDQDETNPNAEAAKYRRKLRETETERDALAERVDALQRAEVDRIVADQKMRPAGLWAYGTTLADLLDNQGNVDETKVKAAAKTAAKELGLHHGDFGAVVPAEGRSPSNYPTQSWESAFKG